MATFDESASAPQSAHRLLQTFQKKLTENLRDQHPIEVGSLASRAMKELEGCCTILISCCLVRRVPSWWRGGGPMAALGTGDETRRVRRIRGQDLIACCGSGGGG